MCVGEVVNLGLGIFMFMVNYLDVDVGVIFYIENGVFGFGGCFVLDVIDSDFINVGCELIILLFGVVFMDFVMLLGVMCNGYIDVMIFGVL